MESVEIVNGQELMLQSVLVLMDIMNKTKSVKNVLTDVKLVPLKKFVSIVPKIELIFQIVNVLQVNMIPVFKKLSV